VERIIEMYRAIGLVLDFQVYQHHRKYIVPLKYGDQLVMHHFTIKMCDTNGQHVSGILLSWLKHILLVISQTDGAKFSEEFHVLVLANIHSFHLLCESV
jgi:hypothetical protein